METAKPMGALLPGIVDPGMGVTVSSGPLTKPSEVLDLDSLPKRLDDRTLALLKEISDSPLPAPVRADDEHFAKCLRSMAILPGRKEDEISGKLRHKLYAAKLQVFSNEALSYLVSKVLDQCQWFPSIAECLAILRTWPSREVAEQRQSKANVLFQTELQTRMNEALAELEARALDQAAIDALPAKIKRIAAEKGYLWAWPDGRFTVRVDIFALPPEQQEAEREKNRVMMAEWAQIEAEMAEARNG